MVVNKTLDSYLNIYHMDNIGTYKSFKKPKLFKSEKAKKINDKIQYKLADIIVEYQINPNDKKSIKRAKAASRFVYNYIVSLKNDPEYNATPGQFKLAMQSVAPYLSKFADVITGLF
jgi:hypothetical protein